MREGPDPIPDWRRHEAERASTDAMHAAGQRLAAVLRAAGHREAQGTWDFTPTEGWTVSPAWDARSQGVHHVTTPEDHAGRRAGLRAYAATLEAAGVPFWWHQEEIDGQPYEKILVRVEADPGHPEELIGADALPAIELALCPHCKSAVPVGHRPDGRCWYCRHRPDWVSVRGERG